MTSYASPLMFSHVNADAYIYVPTDNACRYTETSFTSPKPKGDTVKICIDDRHGSSESLNNTDVGGHTGRNGRLHSSFVLFHSKLEGFLADQVSLINKICVTLLASGYLVYFAYALYLHVTKQCDINIWPLVSITWAALFIVLVRFVFTKFGDCIRKLSDAVRGAVMRKWFILKWIGLLLIYGGMLAVTVLTVWKVPSNLVSLAGIIVFTTITFIVSSNPTQVKWQPVIAGFTLQFYFALIILRWDIGYSVFSFLGDSIHKFLSFSDVGAKFVFGNKYIDHIFAMKVLPVVIFFSCVISILYYLGIMQTVIKGIAWVMQVALGTTAVESLSAASNIFIGIMEASILIGPYVQLMTKSELHAVMVGGFATIAGGVLAAYVSFGVPVEHLLCASVMSAPCALAISKMLYPELEQSKLKDMSDIDVHNKESKPQNVLGAAAAGASASISLVANIAVNLIAMLGVLAFINAVISWFGAFVCYDGLTFEKICSYLLMPIAYLMGVPWEDAGVVGELLGIKTFLNEFIAYKELTLYMTNRQECAIDKPMISERSEIITTYALCGFSNLGTIGMQLGALGPMAPRRVSDLAQLVGKALFGGIITCLLTACVAGLLMEDHTGAMISCAFSDVNSTAVNTTVTMNMTLDSTILNSTLNYS